MFNKNKKPAEILPANQKPKEKMGIVANKDAATNPRDNNKDSKPEKSAAQDAEGRKN